MIIHIKSIEINMFLGIYEHEKIISINALIDIEIELIKPLLTERNNLEELVDYDSILKIIQNRFEGARVSLIEDLIFQIYNEIKPSISIADNVLIRVSKLKTHSFASCVSIEEKFVISHDGPA